MLHSRIACAQVKVQKAVAIQITKVRTHGFAELSEVSLGRHVVKTTLSASFVQTRQFNFYGLTLVTGSDLRHHFGSSAVTGNIKVEFSVIVVVPKPCRKTVLWLIDTCRGCNVFKGVVSQIAIESIGLAKIGNIEVNVSVFVKITPGDPFHEPPILHARHRGHVRKCSVTIVAKKLTWMWLILRVVFVFVADKQIQMSVIVEVRLRRRLYWMMCFA